MGGWRKLMSHSPIRQAQPGFCASLPLSACLRSRRTQYQWTTENEPATCAGHEREFSALAESVRDVVNVFIEEVSWRNICAYKVYSIALSIGIWEHSRITQHADLEAVHGGTATASSSRATPDGTKRQSLASTDQQAILGSDGQRHRLFSRADETCCCRFVAQTR